MNNQLEKAINLAQKTGDRLIIFDRSRPDYSYVVMSLNEYEKLVIGKNEVKNLTENELLDRINRDIAIWKNEQFAKEERSRKDKDFFSDVSNKFNINEVKYSGNNSGEPDYLGVVPDFFVTTDDGPSFISAGNKGKVKNHWRIPAERKEAAEEVIEEDRQYLEEITY